MLQMINRCDILSAENAYLRSNKQQTASSQQKLLLTKNKRMQIICFSILKKKAVRYAIETFSRKNYFCNLTKQSLIRPTPRSYVLVQKFSLNKELEMIYFPYELEDRFVLKKKF